MEEHIDVAYLPEGLVALSAPGDELHITRDRESIATISGAVDPHGRATESPPPADGNVTVVATAMKLSASARTSLSERLGPDYLVLDMNSAPKSVDVLLTPPTSPRLAEQLDRTMTRLNQIAGETSTPLTIESPKDSKSLR